MRFGKTENPFMNAIIFGVMYQKLKTQDILLEKAEETLGTIFFEKLKKIDWSIMLDHSASGFFNQRLTTNNVLSEYGFFLQFYERRNKFRFQLRQNLKEKNKMKKELSACVISKFNGYRFLRHSFRFEEKKDLILINIVYEPTLNDQKPIECFFAPEIEKAYYTSFEVERGGKKSSSHRNAKQCSYCEKCFVKSMKNMEKHLSVCAGKIGINYVFHNGKILNYQDNYNKLGDLPFAIYYDFETTTGSVTFFDAKMYVVSYCIIIAFHPELKLPRVVVYRSYDQNKNEISSLSHFQISDIDFFKNTKINKVTLKQLENSSFSVQNKDNCNALAEMFNIELKFTVDCLESWIQHRKVLKLDEETKMDFRTLNPQTNETICTICDFPLNPRVENELAKHIFKAEYLFLENIFSQKQLVKLKIENFERYCLKLNKILDNFDEFCKSVNQEADDEIIEKIK